MVWETTLFNKTMVFLGGLMIFLGSALMSMGTGQIDLLKGLGLMLLFFGSLWVVYTFLDEKRQKR